MFGSHARRQRGFDHLAERAGIVIGDPTRELQDLGTANRSRVDQDLRVFDVEFSQIFGKLVEKVDDVGSDDIPSQWNYDTSADLCFSTLVGSQSVSKCLQYVKRDCDFGIHAHKLTQKKFPAKAQRPQRKTYFFAVVSR